VQSPAILQYKQKEHNVNTKDILDLHNRLDELTENARIIKTDAEEVINASVKLNQETTQLINDAVVEIADLQKFKEQIMRIRREMNDINALPAETQGEQIEISHRIFDFWNEVVEITEFQPTNPYLIDEQ
jgi:hypothetical protein